MKFPRDEFWSPTLEALYDALSSSSQGLTEIEAQHRGAEHVERRLEKRERGLRDLLLAQFESPIVLTLLFAAGLSLYLGSPQDGAIILGIVLASAGLGCWQEYRASQAVAQLMALVKVTAEVLRDRRQVQVPVGDVVPGDVVLLSAGDAVPGDGRVIDSRDLFVDEAVLTGETFPVDKLSGTVPPDTPLAKRTNCLLLGTHVVSGTARVLVVRIGRDTELGAIADRLRWRAPETEFEHGVRRFGYFLMEVTLVLVGSIFAFNVYFARPVLESLEFSLALAVGLTPQLLPAIISVNVAHGARRMARAKVIVRRLVAIENFGSMDVLCADKTGTLTAGVVRVNSVVDAAGLASEKAVLVAYLNAALESGFANPLDQAIRADLRRDIGDYEKQDEAPYDFVRKRLSVLVRSANQRWLTTKGAVANVLDVCTTVELGDGTRTSIDDWRPRLAQRFEDLSRQGLRTLGVAYRELGAETADPRGLECGMTFLGFLALDDPPRADIASTLEQLCGLGIELKIITGDNHLVAAQVAREVGLVKAADLTILTGPELRILSDEALAQRVGTTQVFAEIEPNQKERIILALRKAGRVVGYLGDGINDASALHAADLGISVATAVDVAREAADIVLLEHNLNVLVAGVQEGRATFANTLKYVFMATSANFGNMFSMAGASLFLPFLPLLPKQVLLTNLLTDLPEMTIAHDRVDREWVDRPRRWDVRRIRNFMLVFGTLSSVFDFLTFGILHWLALGIEQFRTGWFLESVVSAALIVLVIRTRRPCFRSRPGNWLLAVTIVVVLVTFALPYTPLAASLGLTPLPPLFLLLLSGIVAAYVVGAEATKAIYYRRTSRRRAR